VEALKIAYIYDGIYPYVIGGLAKRIHDISKKMAKRGHEVHLYGMKFWNGPAVLMRDGVTIHGVCPVMKRYIGSRRSVRAALAFAYNVFKALMNEGKSFDIIDSALAPLSHQLAVKLRTELRDEGLVITCAEVWAGYWYEYMGIMGGLMGLPMEKLSVRLADMIIAISEKVAHDLTSLGTKASKIRIVEDGIDFHSIQRVKPAEEEADLIFVGRLVSHKRVSDLLKAVGILRGDMPDIRCIIIGDGPEMGKL